MSWVDSNMEQSNLIFPGYFFIIFIASVDRGTRQKDGHFHDSMWLLDIGGPQQYKAWSKTQWKHFVWPAHCRHPCTVSSL